MKEFVIITIDGRTFDNDGKEFENCQILDFVIAETAKDAINQFQKNGSYKKIAAYEINRKNGIKCY
ncbi:MAG: hypothetical protein IJ566_01185 [Cardiobacteriaceae bacterium]|nr:hypothetical protein [Cardiobacteriaceae bacterium]